MGDTGDHRYWFGKKPNSPTREVTQRCVRRPTYPTLDVDRESDPHTVPAIGERKGFTTR
jgi:hypothetical protein